jgi:hypothetical protein
MILVRYKIDTETGGAAGMKATIAIFFLSAIAALGEAAWDQEVLQALERSDPKAAIRAAEDHGDSTQGRLLLFAAYAQKYDIHRDSRAMAKATALYKQLLTEVAMDDVATLHELRRLKGSLLHSYSETLLDQALRRVRTPEEALAISEALRVIYRSERYKAFAGLSDWLSSQRKHILQGDALDDTTKQVFLNEELIMALLDNMETNKKPAKVTLMLASPKPGAPSAADRTPKPSHLNMPRTNATAQECLILIEEPAICHVKSRLPELGEAGVSLLSDLCAAKSIRESAHPGFEWSTGCVDQ